MAYSEGLLYTQRTGICSTSTGLTTSQFYAVTNMTAMVVATAAKNCDGILQGNPDKGQSGPVAVDGVCKAAISASQALTAGVTLLEVDSGGTLKVTAAGTVVAKAMESLSSTASVQIVAVEMLRSNAPFS